MVKLAAANTTQEQYMHSSINPLSAMTIVGHRTVVNFQVLAQKGFIGTGISMLKCMRESLTVSQNDS